MGSDGLSAISLLVYSSILSPVCIKEINTDMIDRIVTMTSIGSLFITSRKLKLPKLNTQATKVTKRGAAGIIEYFSNDTMNVFIVSMCKGF